MEKVYYFVQNTWFIDFWLVLTSASAQASEAQEGCLLWEHEHTYTPKHLQNCFGLFNFLVLPLSIHNLSQISLPP